MATQYKRTRIKTGPNSWINVTTRSNGTSSRSSSTSVAGRTTNISSRGVTRTTNNNGWVSKSFTPAFPKPKKSSTKSRKKNVDKLWANTFSFLTKKKKSAPKKSSQIPPKPWPGPAPKVEKKFDSDKFVENLEKLDKSLEPLEIDKWTGKQQLAFIIIVSVICFVIQILIR